MIFTTGELLERLDQMPDDQLLKLVNAVWEPFDADDHWDSKTAPDRETFKALLRALTDDWAPQLEANLDHQSDKQGASAK